jgi:hypothetical protein
MTDKKKTDPRILAGEFVLADADGDAAKAQAVLNRVKNGEVATMEFIIALARGAAEVLQLAVGDEWRDVLRGALLRMEIQAVSDELGTD